MKSRAAAILLAIGFVAALGYLLGVEFAGGAVYPEYSSLRSDPKGAKLLLDSLARIAGVSAERSYMPFDYLPGDHTTLLLLGIEPEAFAKDPETYLVRIEKFAARGNRVVAALEHDPDEKLPPAGALFALWQVNLGLDEDHLYFQAEGWQALEAVGDKLFAVERPFGKGSVVLLAASDDFNNQSTASGDRLKLVSAAIGPNRRILFDEPHLGISESGSVVGLVRRFRLSGLALGLASCAALWIWKNAAVFPPPAVAPPRNLSGRTSLSGLLTLLRRHIPANEVAAVCWREWLTAHRREITPASAASAEEILRHSAARPLDAAREIQAVLHPAVPHSTGLHSKGSL
jgi:hypothetical protein